MNKTLPKDKQHLLHISFSRWYHEMIYTWYDKIEETWAKYDEVYDEISILAIDENGMKGLTTVRLSDSLTRDLLVTAKRSR